MVALTSIRRDDHKIEIVNKLLLPHTVEFVPVDTIEQAHDAIKTMKVASFIGSIVLLTIFLVSDPWCPSNSIAGSSRVGL